MKLYVFHYTSRNDRGTYQRTVFASSAKVFQDRLYKWNLAPGWKYWETEEQKKQNENPREIQYEEHDLPLNGATTAYFRNGKHGSIQHFFVKEK